MMGWECEGAFLGVVMGANPTGRVHPYEEPAYEVHRMEDV